ncbi:MAG: hypothetical protein JEZ04_02345 [Spirochaetales bacterium]|nr:hypothetical protein [Spirochaetales bacterium]
MMLNRVEKIDNNVKINNILVSTADKAGLDEFVTGLIEVNPTVMIYSTGGTYSRIKDILGLGYAENLTAVSDYTGQPEMQGGLVKTLDFKIYLGLLSETYNDAHRDDLSRTGAVEFDMVIVNLYPFSETVKKKDVTLEDARANIDIGGPCMLRASAKNFLRVASVCNPADYGDILKHLKENSGSLSLDFRFRLAKTTFAHTAEYDSAISSYLNGTIDADAVYDLV